MKRRMSKKIGILLCVLLLGGCSPQKEAGEGQNTGIKDTQTQQVTQEETSSSQDSQTTSGETQTNTQQATETEKPSDNPAETQAEENPGTYVPTHPVQDGVGIRYETNPNAPWIAIDAGHQAKGNSEKEPVGPGASTTKAKVSSGTQGVATGIPEYKLTLEVALRLRDECIAQGYNVLMIRETNDVNISNAERAILANEQQVAAFVRIHADGAENSSANGITVLCQTKDNPYCGKYYKKSRALADALSKNLEQMTGATNRGISEVDNMSGINWCTVPVAIVEMGFMTNEAEDRKMATEEYQIKLVNGMVTGINEFLGR